VSWRSRLFGMFSRICVAAYRRFPVFGYLRGAIAVVPHADGYLMIERADGLGLCFPGGLVHPWESPESALRREIQEETGMTAQTVENWFDYRDRQLYPTHIFVFHAKASGQIRGSFEGDTVIANLAQMEARVLTNQQQVVARLRQAK